MGIGSLLVTSGYSAAVKLWDELTGRRKFRADLKNLE